MHNKYKLLISMHPARNVRNMKRKYSTFQEQTSLPYTSDSSRVQIPEKK